MNRDVREPLFNRGDLVFFDFNNGTYFTKCKGVIQGTDIIHGSEDDIIEYDIWGYDYQNPGQKCLYKHIDEVYLCPIKGRMIILSGFSGVGKGTVISKLLELHPENYELSVSYTTRSPREGDVDGREYKFVTRNEFEEMIKTDSLLEYAVYAGEYYGTPKVDVYRACFEGKKVILEIEPQGAMEIKKIHPNTMSIFIIPPSFDELLARLRGRGTETEDSVRRRLWQSFREIDQIDSYDIVLENQDVNETTVMVNLFSDLKSDETDVHVKLGLRNVDKIKLNIAKYLYETRESDFEMKLIIKPELSLDEQRFIEDVISTYMYKYDIRAHKDGIIYSKRKPHMDYADIPAGFMFFNRLRKYREYFSVLEYYSYLEGDFNGNKYMLE